MKKYKYLFFDADGTLIDSKNGIIDCVLIALREMGIEEKNPESLSFFVGPPLKDSFMKKYGMTEEDALKAVKIYREIYPTSGMLNVELYDEVESTLKELKNAGFKLFVATSKPTKFIVEILKNKAIIDLFDDICGSNLDNTRNRKSEVINFLLDKNAIVDKKAVLMIGDKSHDIIGARECGIDSCGVLYGYGSKEELQNEKPTLIVKNLKELKDFLTLE